MPPQQTDTKDQILDAAEELLAELGYAGTSLRAITARAGVNLAAVNYHFGSKEELTKAVFARRIAPINAQRVRRLEALGGAGDLEDVVRAFLEPAIEFGRHGAGAAFGRLLGRLFAEAPEFLREAMQQQFGEIARRFGEELRGRLPHLDAVDVVWRLHFMVGAMAHTLCYRREFAAMCGAPCDPDDLDRVREQLVAFVTAGFRGGGDA